MRCTEPKSDRLSFVLHMSYIVLWDASEFIHILFRGQFSPTCAPRPRRSAGCISRSDGIVHFLLPGFPATPPLNHNPPQLGGSTPADGSVKGLLWLGYIGPHGGLAGA